MPFCPLPNSTNLDFNLARNSSVLLIRPCVTRSITHWVYSNLRTHSEARGGNHHSHCITLGRCRARAAGRCVGEIRVKLPKVCLLSVKFVKLPQVWILRHLVQAPPHPALQGGAHCVQSPGNTAACTRLPVAAGRRTPPAVWRRSRYTDRPPRRWGVQLREWHRKSVTALNG